jgi:hypothetical protein
MMNGPFALDHLTVVARSLEEGSAYISRNLGIDMPCGGKHPRMGTHNKLLSLGGQTFLELIAIDPDAPAPTRPRWFDLDRFDGTPKLRTWVLRTTDIRAELSDAYPDSGHATEITRGNLNWLISISDNGKLPMDGAFPTLIEWPDGVEPTESMADLGCRLDRLEVGHPFANQITDRLGASVEQEHIRITQSDHAYLRAFVQTPQGLRVLE